MFLIDLIRFLKGNVKFSVEGRFTERFLNLAARNRLPIWNACHDGERFTGYTLAGKYRLFRPLCRKTHVRMRVVHRFGLPFLIKRYRRRSGALIGLAIFCLVIFTSNLFVWDIEVHGNKKVPASEIIQVAQEQGLRRGRLKSAIDVTKIEEKINVHFDEVGWSAVNLIGTVAEIEVEERVPPPEPLDDQKPCNIIASKGGQIVYMEVYDGQKVASLKSAVKKGDIIVSGITQNKEGGNLLRHARAKVVAEYSETKTVLIPLSQTEKIPQGGMINYKYLNLGSKHFPLFLGRVKTEEKFERIFVRPATLFGIKLPFDLTIRQVIPARSEEITMEKEKAKQMAMAQLELYERQVTGGSLGEREIISREIDGKLTNQGYQITAKYIFREDIGEEEEIFIEKQHNT